jgi:NADH:ubiquinone oxidoreductase subunit C
VSLDIFQLLKTRFGDQILESQIRFGQTEIEVSPESIAQIIEHLLTSPETQMNQLLDLVAIDYLQYPNWHGPRFSIVYLLRSLISKCRVNIRIRVAEESISVPSISKLYKNANWLEREAFDQVGIRFLGHPNLKRILNHHEFIGHPLRKDYPITRRQWLSENESLMDEMAMRLKEKGYTL